MILRGSIYSNTLNMETGITVITPNNMGQAEKYKVCYVLHGLCGGNGDYANFTQLPLYAFDKDIIFICPEVQRSFYTDMKFGYDYFTYVLDELPQSVKLVFNISAAREDTAVIGGSMGGYGALKCALTRPEQYGFCGAFSSGCLFLKDYLPICRKAEKLDFPDFRAIYGDEMEYKPENDIIALAEKAASGKIKPVIYSSCSSNDWLLDDNRHFAEIMKNMPFDFTYEELEGSHDLWFFGKAALRALDFWRTSGSGSINK